MEKLYGKKSSSTKKRSTKDVTKTQPAESCNGVKKKYVKNKGICQVTFRLPREAAHEAKSVAIVGEFNNWDMHAHKLKKLKNGDYTIMLELEPGKEYQYRYCIDERKWENDWNADKYVLSPHAHCENSVVII